MVIPNPYQTPPDTPPVGQSPNAASSKAPARLSKPKICCNGPKRRAYEYNHEPGNPVITLHPQGASSVTLHLDEYWVFLFFRFCAERHRMQVRRTYEGVAREALSQDETMQKTFVGNVFRELDAGSVRNRELIIGKGDQSHEEICFRIFLFCAFYKMETWNALEGALGHVPRYSTFEKDLPIYEATISDLSRRRRKIYTGAFQLVPPTPYFGAPHFAASLRFVLALMQMGLPAKLLSCHYAVDASNILRTVPTLGGFLSLNMLCYLNDSPHLSFSYRNFASCGPGSRAFLRAMFGPCINSTAYEEAGLHWLQKNQWQYWAALGEDPPHAWELGVRPGVRVLDIENALCWCHRYVKDYLRLGYGSVADSTMPVVKPEAFAPAWCDEEKNALNQSKAVFDDDYEEAAAKTRPVKEGVWEVERVVGRKGNRTDPDGLFRVRWAGWPPEDDTYERASTLRDGSADALAEWLEWEGTVWSSIAQVKEKHLYSEVKAELDEDMSIKVESSPHRRTRKRQKTM
ncbi:hypothetical protein BD324DRAFT_627842 [Kockovaella imperatae]|uniref:Chromo domain-containing protein n=1 Tax=Kockovaella imperatae TaxID=4999 RepID=A0A1Y1UFY5_9TREE|nr:hypothetical protein BD324DRAFT_627842 [Kockovaella imperatae]ORX36963.1 hypothetical protein BD324DRAFT_627842 [Kockovaella imperatae]